MRARDFAFGSGDRVFVTLCACQLHIRLGPAYKLTRSCKGLYLVITVYPNSGLQSVDYPKAKTIQVALNRERHCPTTIADKEAVMVKPVTDKDVENPESEEEEDACMGRWR